MISQNSSRPQSTRVCLEAKMNVICAAVFFTLFSIFVMEVIMGFVELGKKKIGTAIIGRRFVCKIVLDTVTEIDFNL